MSDSPKLPDSFEDAERFQRLFVQPLVNAVEVNLKQHTDQVEKLVSGFSDKVDDHAKRIGNLERDQKKALVGWGVLTLAVGTAVTAGWNYIRSKFHLG